MSAEEVSGKGANHAKGALPDGWRWVKLSAASEQDRKTVEPNSRLAAGLPYLSLEHVESNTGRILREPADRIEDEGRSATFAFDSRHVLYGKLRPYLNKVALPGFTGRCTTEIIPLLPNDGVHREFLCWLLRRPQTVEAAMQGKTGSRMPRADMDELMKLEIPLPPFPEQKRIAGILTEQMAAVERARRSAEAQLQAAENLPAAYLRLIFNCGESKSCARRPFTEVCELLPARSVTTNGDTEVLAVTTACLTESGFRPSGVKRARMWGKDAAECVLTAGEILIARSNTPELVGRVAMFSGEPKGAVASDLTIRIRAKDHIEPTFLTAYLSSLYLTGYWRERAGGASGSMKKITRSQIQKEQVPLPPLLDQRRIASQLAAQMASAWRLRRTLTDQLDMVNKLPAALLRRAFDGGYDDGRTDEQRKR